MSTSGTYNFQSPSNVELIEDAYERIGILPAVLVNRQIKRAIRTLNFILTDWMNKGLNLWTVQTGMISLVPNQVTYSMPPYTSDILEVVLRQSQRNLGGTAASSAGGIAGNAFDGNTATACTQNAPNGNISYSWGATAQYAIQLVGVQSNATLTYTLVFEYSTDNGASWVQAYPANNGTAVAQSFPVGNIQWFTIAVPTLGNAFRVRETGGATLNIQELYFDTQVQDTIMNAVSRSEYMSYPNKLTPGRPVLYYFDRQINPVINIYQNPYPGNLYNNIYFTYIQMLQDAGSLQNNIQVPPRFFEPLTAALAYYLHLKQPQPDEARTGRLLNDYQTSFKSASEEDTPRNVPLRIYGDFLQGWTEL